MVVILRKFSSYGYGQLANLTLGKKGRVPDRSALNIGNQLGSRWQRNTISAPQRNDWVRVRSCYGEVERHARHGKTSRCSVVKAVQTKIAARNWTCVRCVV